MSTPLAIGAIAALAAAAELSRRGSRSKLYATDKARIVELVRDGQVDEARALSKSLGQERLYLVGADLTGAILHGANLTGADLRMAGLSGANLSGAHLSEANLTDADLEGANLTGADLTGANLRGAYLRLANLTEANLIGANLTGAYLRQANLTEANLSGADLTGATYVGSARGINLGHDRAFKGVPHGYRIQRSRLSGRDYGLVKEA